MKKFLSFSVALLAGLGAFAQTNAQDWTKPDCSGKNHHLFAELDSGNVVVLEYVMMSCSSCVTAGNGLKTIAAPYKTSHPGRVRVYSIGYTNSYTCAQMQSWQTTNNFTHPVFTNGAADVSYYGGMGMPTIVVVGNNAHKVYYNKQGYATSDNAAITSAINLALSQSSPLGLKENARQLLNLRVYPNPVKDRLAVTFNLNAADQILISDITGKRVYAAPAKGLSKLSVDTRNWDAGLYLVSLLKDGAILETRRFVKE